ncbi:flagellar biosynthesis protein FlgJ [Pukyongiella litopenaei]|uniref:Flagellar biosynthesis protein FlgJ n=2 Tax=Pukyongiella litopenaei TaxID=2605946 RepID=A0A2S0MVA4_9RHOB|nr:rod-binding protein [Pukyongiella litopenaei]AVO39802.1 flagellar biosynthesis protein FlgJ [Pukyongiella litopenaei]
MADPLKDAAIDLEAAFLTEMLKSAGFGEQRKSFGGGAGESQFGTFLVRAQAEQIARSGGIGLAESLYRALLEAEK